jgi:hypothetical protein
MSATVTPEQRKAVYVAGWRRSMRLAFKGQLVPQRFAAMQNPEYRKQVTEQRHEVGLYGRTLQRTTNRVTGEVTIPAEAAAPRRRWRRGESS